jgi:hypothetical protein
VDTASEPFVNFAANAAGSVMPPLPSEVALFSICSQPGPNARCRDCCLEHRAPAEPISCVPHGEPILCGI